MLPLTFCLLELEGLLLLVGERCVYWGRWTQVSESHAGM